MKKQAAPLSWRGSLFCLWRYCDLLDMGSALGEGGIRFRALDVPVEIGAHTQVRPYRCMFDGAFRRASHAAGVFQARLRAIHTPLGVFHSFRKERISMKKPLRKQGLFLWGE